MALVTPASADSRACLAASILRLGGNVLLEQRALAGLGRGGILEAGGRAGEVGLRRPHRQLVGERVERGQALPLPDDVAHIDVTADDAPEHPKAEVGLVPGLDGSGETHGPHRLRGDNNGENGSGCRRLGMVLFLAGGEQADRTQGSQGCQDRVHGAAPSVNATTWLGRRNCAPAGHDDLAGLEPLPHDDLSGLVAFNGDRPQRHRLGPGVDGPHGRLAVSAGKGAPRDHHELAGLEPALADDGGAERHRGRRMLDADLGPDGSGGPVHGRGDLTHGALCLHGRIGHQRQRDGGIGELAGEDRLVDVEHRVAWSVLGDREDGLRRLHDLPRLGLAGRDDAGNARPQHRVGKMVAGGAELGPCGVERGLRRTEGFLSLIVLPLGRVALGEQRLLAFVAGGRLAEHGLGGLDGGLGGGHRRLLLLRVESGQHLVGRHVVADIDQALGDAAAHPKGQIALDLRADFAGQPHRRRIVGQRGRLDLHHGWRVLRPARLLLAGRQTRYGNNGRTTDHFTPLTTAFHCLPSPWVSSGTSVHEDGIALLHVPVQYIVFDLMIEKTYRPHLSAFRYRGTTAEGLHFNDAAASTLAAKGERQLRSSPLSLSKLR